MRGSSFIYGLESERGNYGQSTGRCYFATDTGKWFRDDGPTVGWIEIATGGGGLHPDLTAHNTLGLTTQAELDAHVHAHTALTGVSADQHHAQSHGVTAIDHTASGLTAGHVLRASGTSTFVFAAIADADLPSTITRDSELPVAASTVVAETAFGQTSAIGTGAAYARNDHTHGSPTNPVTAHESASDPHAGYQRESEKDAASGYAGLNASTQIATLQLGSGTADGTTFLRGDRTWAVPSGGGGSTEITRIAGSSGAAGADITYQRLTANSADVTSTGLSSSVMTTTGVGAGTWKFKYTLIYQTAATTTGIAYGVNHTGTVGQFQAMWTHVTTGGAAATGVGDSDTTVVAGQLVEGKHDGGLNAIIGSASSGVDTVNADILVILEGIAVVTASGNLELKIASEVLLSAVRIMANSCLELIKIG